MLHSCCWLDSSHLYASLLLLARLLSLVCFTLFAGSTRLILTNGSHNSGVNLNGRGPLIDFLHQIALLHYWLLLTANALPQPISFVLIKIMFQSLLWVEVGLSILPPLHSH